MHFTKSPCQCNVFLVFTIWFCHITQHINLTCVCNAYVWWWLAAYLSWHFKFYTIFEPNIITFSIAILMLLSCHPIEYAWCLCLLATCYSISILFFVFPVSRVTGKHVAFHYTSFQFDITSARSHAWNKYYLVRNFRAWICVIIHECRRNGKNISTYWTLHGNGSSKLFICMHSRMPVRCVYTQRRRQQQRQRGCIDKCKNCTRNK